MPSATNHKRLYNKSDSFVLVGFLKTTVSKLYLEFVWCNEIYKTFGSGSSFRKNYGFETLEIYWVWCNSALLAQLQYTIPVTENKYPQIFLLLPRCYTLEFPPFRSCHLCLRRIIQEKKLLKINLNNTNYRVN